MNSMTIAARSVRRNLGRSILTVLALAVTTLTFLLLRTVVTAWAAGVEYSAKDRVATRHKVTFTMTLPKRYVDDVRLVSGVQSATWLNWFGGKVPGKENQFFGSMAIDAASFFDVFNEIQVTDEQKQRFLVDRRGALIGAALARQFQWQVGDRVVLEGSTYPGTWEFTVDGIYTSARRSMDKSAFYFHWQYLNDGAALQQRDQIGWITSRVADARDAAEIGKRIDALFATRGVRTLSMSERAMNTSFIGMISALLGAVSVVSVVLVCIMLLVLGNTLAMGVRERTREYGALRAIGFRPRQLSLFIVGEAMAIGLMGATVGVVLGVPFINAGVGRFLEENMAGFFPYFRVSFRDVVAALVVSMLVAALAALLPARRVGRLTIADALRVVD